MSLETEILILEACAACKEAVVPLEVKSWPSTLPLVLPGLALRSGLAVVRPDEMLVRTYPNCLINVIASLCPACDVSSFLGYDDALSAESFNATIVHSSQRATDAGFRLVHVAHNDLMEPQPSATFYAHYPLPNGLGHWYGLQYLESKLISIVDVDAGSRRLDLSCEAELPEETGPEYKLQGSMMRSDMAQSSTQEIVTPLTCQECGAPLAPAHAVSGRLYTLRGMEDMSMINKRCSKKTCRVHHHYNYRKVEGHKYHTLDLEKMDYVFVNSKLGFSDSSLTTTMPCNSVVV